MEWNFPGWTFRCTCHFFPFLDIHLPHNITIGFVCGSHRRGQERWLRLTLVTRATKQQSPLSLFLSHFALVIYLSSAVPPNEATEKKLAECCTGLIDGVIKVAQYRLTRTCSRIPLFVIEMVIYTGRTQSWLAKGQEAEQHHTYLAGWQLESLVWKVLARSHVMKMFNSSCIVTIV